MINFRTHAVVAFTAFIASPSLASAFGQVQQVP